MEDKDARAREKKGLFAVLKESMSKSSSGCGPGCGCHVEKQDKADDPRGDAGRGGLPRDGERA